MAGRFSRRTLLAGALAGTVTTACGRKRAPRYQGWLFVASRSAKAIAVVDLASFRRVTTIPLSHAPDQILHAGEKVFATSPDGHFLAEIDVRNLTAGSKTALPGRPIGARLSADAQTAIILTDDPGGLVRVDLKTHRVIGHVALSGSPSDLDTAGEGQNGLAAVSIPSRNSIVRVSLPALRIESETNVGLPCGPLRFRRDGRTILAGAATSAELVTVESEHGQLLARLPLAIVPSRFCFNSDGGQMFVTGNGSDVIAIVDPFQNQVEETILAGRTPCAMAVSDSRNLLFVTNLESGDLTILNIETRSVSASVHVGENPNEVVLTPDGEYALALDRRSGNVAVVRVPTVIDPPNPSLASRVRTRPLFTVFPTAPEARSALVVPFQI